MISDKYRMGGFGSGRRGYRNSKNTVESCRSLDVRYFQRKGWLVAGRSLRLHWQHDGQTDAGIGVSVEHDHLVLNYRCSHHGGDWQDFKYSIPLVTTPCNYGGVRFWFCCPASGCGRRVATLYQGGSIFACRHCYRLAYACQRESVEDRLTRKIGKMRKRLGWEPGFLNGHGWKLNGMHWRTYSKLVIGHDELALALARRMLEWAERQQERVARLLAEHPEWDIDLPPQSWP